MLKRSRGSWTTGRMIQGVALVVMVAAPPSVLQAQEYLPPVIDRSSTIYQDKSSQNSQPSSGSRMSLEQRLERLERLMESQALVDMLMRLDSVEAEVDGLRGDAEILDHDLNGIKQQQRDLYLDIDRRLRQVELAVKQPSVSAASSGVTAPAGGSVAPQAGAVSMNVAVQTMVGDRADPAQERQAYQAAFSALKEGRYKDAIAAFEAFLAAYPAGDFTDNAQYWLGEANYVTRQFRVAEREFLKVLNQHADSPKVADATLKLGYTYYELGDWDAARKTLADAVARFPNSTVAKLAQNRLQKMRLEGR